MPVVLPTRLTASLRRAAQADSVGAFKKTLGAYRLRQDLRLSDGHKTPLAHLLFPPRARRLLAWMLDEGLDPWCAASTVGPSAWHLALDHWPAAWGRLRSAPAATPDYCVWKGLVSHALSFGTPTTLRQVWELAEPRWLDDCRQDANTRQGLWYQAFRDQGRAHNARARTLAQLMRPVHPRDQTVWLDATLATENRQAWSLVLAHAPDDPAPAILRAQSQGISSSWAVHACGHPPMFDWLASRWRRQWGQASLDVWLDDILRTVTHMAWSPEAIVPLVRKHARVPWSVLSARAAAPWPNLLLLGACVPTGDPSARRDLLLHLHGLGDDPLARDATGQTLLHALLSRRLQPPYHPLLTWAQRQGVSWFEADPTGCTALDLLRAHVPTRAARIEQRHLRQTLGAAVASQKVRARI